MSGGLDAVRDAKTILLATYKRHETPVSVAFGGRAHFRSYDKAWKARRLRGNLRVEVAASTLRGGSVGPVTGARAVLLDGGQARVAARVLGRRHRLVPLARRLMGCQAVHYELRPE